tara:strand:- start:3406 stop:3669 length:264 start_codon:yes stop_codon:yes gene_type:complete
MKITQPKFYTFDFLKGQMLKNRKGTIFTWKNAGINLENNDIEVQLYDPEKDEDAGQISLNELDDFEMFVKETVEENNDYNNGYEEYE